MTRATTCPTQDDLIGFLAGRLAPPEETPLAEHVNQCLDCQKALDRLTDCSGDQAFQGLKPAREAWTDAEFGRRLRELTPPPSERPPVVSVPRPWLAPEPTAVLRRRLRVLHTVSLAILLYILLACLAGMPEANLGLAGQLAATSVLGGPGQMLLVAATAFFAASAAFLWIRGHRTGERGLRRLNTADFAVVTILVATWHYRMLTAHPPGGFDSPDSAGLWEQYALTHSLLTWNVFMVAEGLYVPQGPRRCAALMGTAVAVAAATSLAAAWASPAAERALSMQLLEQTAVLGGAAVLCVTSTARIRALEKAARDLGHYRLQRPLGTGGMGEVWLAEHRLLKRPCAVKLVRPDRASDESTIRRFEREVRATADLRHPNVVEVYDYGHDEDGTFYYVMEYLPGLDLEQLVQRHGPLPPARVVHLLRQLCAALKAAHAVGLVHRDLKPANVIVSPPELPDRVKLLDFGLVRPLARTTESTGLTGQGFLVGTPDYMAPEQIAEGAVGHRSDLYGLGAVAYFLLTGRAPFPRPHAMQTLMAHLREPPEPPRSLRPDIPAKLEAVVLRCLAKEPSNRYADADELDQALVGCDTTWTEGEALAWWRDKESSRGSMVRALSAGN
jgi:serine/threonine-protein kinase